MHGCSGAPTAPSVRVRLWIMDPHDATYSINAAAAVCGVHRDTIRRLVRTGRLPTAGRTGVNGPWRIPASDLAAAGLHVDTTALAPPDDAVSVPTALRACAVALIALADVLDVEVTS